MFRKRKQLSKQDRLKQVTSRLKNENDQLRVRLHILEKENQELKTLLKNALLRIAELEEMVFGRKKNKDNDDNNNNGIFSSNKEKKPRNNSSYQRPIPSEREITSEEEYHIDNCPKCKTVLTNKQMTIRYIEDIDFAKLNQQAKTKTVIRQKIEKGFCPKCRKWHAAIPIGKHKVIIGPKTSIFIGYANYTLRMSYQQIIDILMDLYDLRISKGEITNILDRISQKLKIEHVRLGERIRESASVNLDETGWQTGKEKNFAWTIASGESEEASFLIGRSRGKGNAEKLLEAYQGVRITDCYGAYKNLEGEHQVCWVHLIRKAKDLSRNLSSLSNQDKILIQKVYVDLLELYQRVQTATETKFNLKKRTKIVKKIEIGLKQIAENISLAKTDIKKLIALKNQMLAYKKQLLTCLLHENVATNNNKAERKLRHLVLKRKNCFGTKSKKGNKTFEINFSVLMSLWWNNRANFFAKFSGLMQ